MAFVQQVRRLAVVGAETDAAAVGDREPRNEAEKIVRVGRLADEDHHSQAQFFARFFDRGAFMIRADACRHVRHQVAPRQSRRVPVADRLLKSAQLVQHFFVAVDDAGKVHHFAQAQHPGIVQVMARCHTSAGRRRPFPCPWRARTRAS